MERSGLYKKHKDLGCKGTIGNGTLKTVVFSEEEAEQKGLEIDHDDAHALGKKSFALLLHGTQPKGSEASKALQVLRKAGKGGYSQKA